MSLNISIAGNITREELVHGGMAHRENAPLPATLPAHELLIQRKPVDWEPGTSLKLPPSWLGGIVAQTVLRPDEHLDCVKATEGPGLLQVLQGTVELASKNGITHDCETYGALEQLVIPAGKDVQVVSASPDAVLLHTEFKRLTTQAEKTFATLKVPGLVEGEAVSYLPAETFCGIEMKLVSGFTENTEHVHRTMDEYYYILRGTMTIALGDVDHGGERAFTLTPHDIVYIPKGIAHFVVRGSEDNLVLTVYSPRFEADDFEYPTSLQEATLPRPA